MEFTIERSVNDLILISLDIHRWTGQKRLSPADFKATDSIPPSSLASLGSKKIFDPNKLKVFLRLKRKAEKACQANGIKFLGGYLIAEAKKESVMDELNKIRLEWDIEHRKFVSEYADNVASWLNQIPSEWQHIVSNAIESPKTVAGRISFEWNAYKINPVDMGSDNSIEENIKSVPMRLAREISIEAGKSLELSFWGKKEVTQKALRPMKHLAEKAESLAFLNENIQQVVNDVKVEIYKLPKKGPISGADLFIANGCLEQLRSLEFRIKNEQPREEPIEEEPVEVEETVTIVEDNEEEEEWF